MTDFDPAEISQRRADIADAVTAKTKELLTRRTSTLRRRAERAEAAIARVRQALDDESYGGPEREDVITAIRVALDEPTQEQA